MSLRPTRTFISCLCFICATTLLILSCSKDRDLLLDAVLDDDEIAIIEQDSTAINESSEDEQSTDEEQESTPEDSSSGELESRTTVFPTSNDAYLQNGNGFDQDLIRLQENFRRSYLMFDLSQIDAIGGEIISATLEFNINSDNGNGTIKVYKGDSNDWTEDSLTEKSAPEISSELGEIVQEYKIGDKVSIELDVANLFPEVSTLVLEHEDGDDLDFASKENTSKLGPQLVVTYNAPIAEEAISPEGQQVIEGVTIEEDSTEEETSEDDTTEEEIKDTPEEDTPEEETPEEKTPEEPNTAPLAIAEATSTSGDVPLEVNFSGSKSSDDKAITSYEWNFKDGNSASSTNPVHTFTAAGIYETTLIVTDAEGLTSVDTILITVNAPVNKAPVAVASASVFSGDGPLQVNFTGSNSSDDTGIVSYFWDFSGSTSTASNPSYTFQNPGNYNVSLIVTDAEGLTDRVELTITVTEEVINSTDCITSGGLSGDEGLKQWCWTDLEQEINSAGAQSGFSNNQLAKSVHYNANGVFAQNGRLNFKLNPTSSSSNGLNFRQEIRDNPANVRHPIGTEQWWGFDYRFGDDYIADDLPWIMWQTHGYFSSPADPMTALELAPSNYLGNSNPKGELFISNAAFSSSNPKKTPTGIVPRASQTLKIVIQMVWGDNNTGRYKVWIDGVLVYNEQERTVYAEQPEGGYWKVGIYKWRWQSQSNVNISANLGITELHTSIGPLKVIKKSPSNPTYLTNEFNTVSPR